MSGSDPDGREPVASFRHARLAFGERVLWDDLDLDIMPGEFVAVLGQSGSGKTTMLNVVGGLDHPDSGRLREGRHPVLQLLQVEGRPHADDVGPRRQELADRALRGFPIVGHLAFAGEIEGGRLFGRGAADMKSGVAAFVAAGIRVESAFQAMRSIIGARAPIR